MRLDGAFHFGLRGVVQPTGCTNFPEGFMSTLDSAYQRLSAVARLLRVDGWIRILSMLAVIAHFTGRLLIRGEAHICNATFRQRRLLDMLNIRLVSYFFDNSA